MCFRRLLPWELGPGWFDRAGVLVCGIGRDGFRGLDRNGCVDECPGFDASRRMNYLTRFNARVGVNHLPRLDPWFRFKAIAGERMWVGSQMARGQRIFWTATGGCTRCRAGQGAQHRTDGHDVHVPK